MPEPQQRRTRLIAAGLLACVVLTAAATPVFAGKPGSAATSASLVGPSLVVDAAANGVVNRGDSVTFTVSSSAAKPYVGVRCYQGAAFVYDSYVGYYDAAWFAKEFTLSSTYWAASASADCTARLFSYDNRGRERVQATKLFTVAP
jgi:hypothetical protein